MGLEDRYNIQTGFLYLMTFYPEYRNLFYYRIGFLQYFVKYICKPMATLVIAKNTKIGPGLFIQHGIATIIAAKSIGRDCWINQQVTIGYSNNIDSPEIRDNVKIYAGAKIIGNVIVGSGAKVGANAVVINDVPENCTAVGVPAHIIRKES
jgi:serine O-acetyltransferase